jgi:hypothetical protein
MRKHLKLLGITWLLLTVACGDNTHVDEDAPAVDAATMPVDAAVDAAVDAPDTIPRPPLPMPSPCDTCVGFGCDSVCTDAGVDAN